MFEEIRTNSVKSPDHNNVRRFWANIMVGEISAKTAYTQCSAVWRIQIRSHYRSAMCLQTSPFIALQLAKPRFASSCRTRDDLPSLISDYHLSPNFW